MTYRLSALGLLACVIATEAHALPPYHGGQLLAQRPCPNDALVVEAPLWAEAFPSTFRANLQARLGAALTTAWFCSAGEPCVRTDFAARVTAVLPSYTSAATYPAIPARRRDGDRRFYQVDFLRRSGTTWSRTRILDNQACAVVSATRQQAGHELGGAPSSCRGSCAQPRVLVARECLVSGMDAEAWADPATHAWAFDRIGASTMSARPAVDVALVDAGIPVAFRAALGVVSERALPSFYAGPTASYHPHGAHMAALVARAAPHARIGSYRALDGNGVASVGALARAIDDALFPSPTSAGPRAPLVVNLSLGFPAGLTQPSDLRSGSCSTWEDGLGESLRYVLDVAADLDQTTPVFVAAAGGNAIIEGTSPFTGIVRGSAITPCGSDAAGRASTPFSPAALGTAASCRTTWSGTPPVAIPTPRGLPVLSVGASDRRDVRSAITLLGAEPFVLAPGERVYASSAALPPASAAVACGAGDVGAPTHFESPASVSGTSASTALVSAAVARVLGIAPTQAQGVPWRAAHLARLVHLSGAALCHASPHRTRLDVARLEHAALAPACAGLRACVASGAHPLSPIVGDQTFALCGAAASSCFASYPTTPSPSCTAPLPPGDEWPAGFVASLGAAPSCTLSLGVSATPGAPVCTAGACVHEDTQLAGLRPQPTTLGCPDCRLVVERERLEVQGEVTDALAPGSLVRNPYLVLIDERKQPTWYSMEAGRPWKPGDVFAVSLALPMAREELDALFERGGSAAIDMEVIAPDGRAARLVSPLAIVPR